MERWVEHYTELYARENVVTEDALNAIERLPELEDLGREPTIDELSEALDSLASGKAPGKDGIPAEVLKCCKETLITELHEILCLCWNEGEVPQDMRDANVVTLYKNKGDCNKLHFVPHQSWALWTLLYAWCVAPFVSVVCGHGIGLVLALPRVRE